jgi:hypothetical protein
VPVNLDLFVRGRAGIQGQTIHALRPAERGLIAADLGGGAIKQRIARFGEVGWFSYDDFCSRQAIELFSFTASPRTKRPTSETTSWLPSVDSHLSCCLRMMGYRAGHYVWNIH